MGYLFDAMTLAWFAVTVHAAYRMGYYSGRIAEYEQFGRKPPHDL